MLFQKNAWTWSKTWCTFDALLMHFWCTFDALLMHFWCTFDAFLMHFWCTFGALLMHFRCTFDALLMHFWCTVKSDALLMHFWCTFDALLPPFDALLMHFWKVHQKCVKRASKVRQEFMTFFVEKIKNDKVLSKEIACIEFEVKLIQCSLK